MSSVAEQGGQSSGQQETGPNKITGAPMRVVKGVVVFPSGFFE